MRDHDRGGRRQTDLAANDPRIADPLVHAKRRRLGNHVTLSAPCVRCASRVGKRFAGRLVCRECGEEVIL